VEDEDDVEEEPDDIKNDINEGGPTGRGD